MSQKVQNAESKKTVSRFRPELFEAFFDIAYLAFAPIVGSWFLIRAIETSNGNLIWFAVMAHTLGSGDAFHLVPRIAGIFANDNARFAGTRGIGKFVTSITMTAFYVILFLLWESGKGAIPALRWAIGVITAIRIALCLFPQNKWSSDDSPFAWEIARNIPFTVLDAIICVAFALRPLPLDGLRLMPVAIAASFAFYAPVILFVKKHPAVGMLMIPKTLCYVWMIAMGFSLFH
jgi:hypothetical protein